MPSISLKLTPKDIRFLDHFKHDGAHRSVRQLNRANILLLLHKKKAEKDIAEFLGVERTTVWRTKKRYLVKGVRFALEEDPRSGQPKKYTMDHQTELVAIACSKAPEGAEHWTMELLKSAMRNTVKGCKTINRETIRLMLKKTNVSLG